MGLLELSDKEVLAIAQPMIEDIVRGSNTRNWSLFSKYQTSEEANDPDNRRNVEKQWQEHAFLTSLSSERDVLGVLRRDDSVQIVWRQTSTKISGDFLARLYLKEIGGEIKEIAFLLQ